jgi:hypothetical protein
MPSTNSTTIPIRGGENAATAALAVMDETLTNVVIISPASEFTTTRQYLDTKEASLSFGIQGRVNSVPKGHIAATILHLGGGVNEAMLGWGRYLLQRAGKPADGWKDDYSLNYLGYTTDSKYCTTLFYYSGSPFSCAVLL